MTETTEFLEQLWAGKPDDLYMLIWTHAGKQSAWFTDIEQAAIYAVGCAGDTYVGVGLSSSDNGESLRCAANDIVGIAGMWADVDYEDGAAHKSSKKNLPLAPTDTDARKIIEAVGLKPTLIVHSGHGLQAWWLLKEPLIFDNETERKAAAAMARLWQRNIHQRAELMGWSVDSVPDLARLLRVPGTQNCKIPDATVPVRLILSDGPWYLELSDFEEVLPESIYEDARLHTEPGELARGRDYWKETIQGVSEGDRNTRMTSFAGKLFNIIGDIDDQDGGFLVLQYMLLVNEKNDPPLEESEVRNSWQSIWKKERATRAGLEAGLEAEKMFDDQNHEILSEEGSVDKKMELVSNYLGGIPIKEITKRGKQKSEYAFELQDGAMIVVGSILDQRAVRKAVLDATSGDNAKVVPMMKMDRWNRLCGKIAELAREIEMPDAERKEHVLECLQHYLNRTSVLPEGQWKGALNDGSPFKRSGLLYVNVAHFFSGVRFEANIKDGIYLRGGLVDLGFKPQKIQAWIENEKGDKKNKTRHYWYQSYDDAIFSQVVG